MADQVTTDSLKKFFVSDRSKRDIGADATERIKYYADQAGADLNETIDRALMVQWMAARTGKPSQNVSDDLDSYVTSYFGKPMTPSAAYDTITANYDALSRKTEQPTPEPPKEQSFVSNAVQSAGLAAARGTTQAAKFLIPVISDLFNAAYANSAFHQDAGPTVIDVIAGEAYKVANSAGKNVDAYYTPDQQFQDSIAGQATSMVGSIIGSVPALLTGPVGIGVYFGASSAQDASDKYLSNIGVTEDTATPEQLNQAKNVGGLVGVPVGIINSWGVGKLLGVGERLFGAPLTKQAALKTVLGLKAQTAYLSQASASVASSMYSNAIEKITSAPDSEVFSNERIYDYFKEFVGNYIGAQLMSAGAGGIKALSSRSPSAEQTNIPVTNEGITMPAEDSAWSPHDNTPPMPEDYALLRSAKTDGEIKELGGDLLLKAANGDEVARDEHQKIVAEEQKLPIEDDATSIEDAKTITNELASEDISAGVDKESSVFLKDSDVTDAQKTFEDAITRRFGEQPEIQSLDAINKLAEESSTGGEGATIRKQMESESRVTAEQIREQARKMSAEVWTAKDDRLVWAMVKKTTGAGRTNPRVFTRYKSEAKLEHDALFEKYFGQLKNRVDVESLKRNFEEEFDAYRKTQAEKLANNSEVRDAINQKVLDRIVRQKQFWKDTYNSTKDREKWLRQNMRVVEQLLPMEVRGELGKMRPPSEGFKSNGQAEKFIDNYLNRAAEVHDAYKADIITAKINDFIKRNNRAYSKAERGVKLKYDAQPLLDYVTKFTRERTESDEMHYADLLAKHDALTPEEQVFVDDWIQPRQGDKLTSDDLSEIYANLKNLKNTGRTEWQAREDAKHEGYRAFSNLAKTVIKADPTGMIAKGLRNTANFMRAHGVAGFEFYDTLLAQATGDRNNPMTRMIHGKIEPAAMQVAINGHEYVDHFKTFKEGLGLKKFDAGKYLTGEKGKPVVVNGKKVRVYEAMEWYALMKNDNGKGQLIGRADEETGIVNGGSNFNKAALSKADVTRVVDSIPEPVRKLADEYIRYNDEVMYPLINAWYKAKYGVNLPKEKFYFPIRNVETQVDFMQAIRRMGRPPYLKARTGSTTGITDFDFFKKQNSFVNQAIRVTAFDQPMSDLRAMFFNEKQEVVVGENHVMQFNPLRRALDNFDPTVTKQLETYFNDVERGGRVPDTDQISKALDYLRRNANTAIIALNPGSTVKVLGSQFTGMNRLENPTLAVATITESSWNFANMRKFMREHSGSATVLERNSIVDQKALSETVGIKAKAQRAGYFGMRAVDEYNCVTLWNARYREVLAKTHDIDESVYQADRLVIDTQSSWEYKDMAEIYRNGGFVSRVLLQFTNDANHSFNEFLKDVAESKNVGDLVVAGLREGSLLYVLPAMTMVAGDLTNKKVRNMFEYAWRDAFGGYRPDRIDWQDYVVQDAIYQGKTYPFQAFPLISDLSQYIASQGPNALYKGGNINQTLLPSAATSVQQGRIVTPAMQLFGIPGANIIGTTLDKKIKEGQ